MKKRYLLLTILVVTLFSFYELSKPRALKKPPKTTKKLKIIEFELPKYDFTPIVKLTTPKKEVSHKRVKVRQKPTLVKETSIIEMPMMQTIKEAPKEAKSVSKEIIKKEKPPQEMVEATVGDDVESQLNEIKNMRQALLRSKKTPLFIKESIEALESLRDKYGVDLGFAYRSVVQSDFVSKEIAGGGNIDIIAMYKPNKSSTFAINLNASHRAGEQSSSSFAKEIGSLYTTSPSYSNKDAQVTEFWYQYRLDELTLRLGIVDAGSFVDSSFYMSSNNFFFNSSISSAPYSSTPSNGLGVGFNYKTESFYISSQLSDANAKTGTSIGSSLDRMVDDSLSLYSAIEFGILNGGSFYYINLWHKEQDRDAQGVVLSLNQELDATHKVFLKVAISKEASAKEYLSLGWGRNDIFSQNDKTGIAYSAAKSQNTQQIQNNFEMFYRYDFLYGIQLSANIELLNPINSKEDLAVLGGLRLRLVF